MNNYLSPDVFSARRNAHGRRHEKTEPDRSRINLNEDHEVRYWCKQLRVTPDELQQLVAMYGNSADKIRAGLGG
jgi:hypothetical protein